MQKRNRLRGIDRRAALQRLLAGAGASTSLRTLTPSAAAANCSDPTMPMPDEQALGSALPPDPSLTAKNWKPKFFDLHQNETMIVLSDLIIPDTDAPGAKGALANRFIDLLLSASEPEVQKGFIEALSWLDGYCLSHYTQPFTQLNLERQKEVLALLTHKNYDPESTRGAELFRVIKSAIVQAYYYSEIGMLQELKYQTNPFQSEFPGCPNPDKH